MLSLSDDLAKLFAARDLGDPSVRLCRHSALSYHLGLPLLAPYAVAVAKKTKLREAGPWIVIHRDPLIGRPVRVDGIQVASIIETLLGCTAAEDAWIDAESVAKLAERVAKEPRKRRDLQSALESLIQHPSLRRLLYVLERAGLSVPVPTEVSRTRTLLRKSGLDVGVLHEPTGVVVNAPDGFETDPASAEQLAKTFRAALSADARTLLDVCALGLELDSALCSAWLGSTRGEQALQQLEQYGLVRSQEGWRVPVAPLSPQALLPSIPKRQQVVIAERALALLEGRKEPKARRNLLRVLMLLEHPEAVARLSREASAALDLGSLQEVRGWLAALQDRATPEQRPDLARLEMKLLEREGRSREALSLAHRVVRSLTKEQRAERRDFLLEEARLAWQQGQARKAESLLSRVRPLLRGEEQYLAQCRFRLLRATIALEQGKVALARVTLKSARAMAELSDDPEALAQVLRRIGTMEARAGRPHDARAAYEAALSALSRVTAPTEASLEAVLESNLATALAWLGEFDEAERRYRRALKLREGMALGSLNTRAALALLDVARSRPVAPEGRFGPLAMQAEVLGDARLRVELNLYLAEELIAEHDLTRAARALAQARTALAELGGAETILEQMLACTDATLRAARGDSFSLTRFESAIAALKQIGADYHAARAARTAASAAANLGDDVLAERFLTEAARCAMAGDFVLGAEAEHTVVYALGSLSSAAWLKTYCDGCLDRIGRARVAGLLNSEGREDLALRLVALGPGPRPMGTRYRCDGPEGSRWLTPSQRQRLREVSPGCVVLDLTDGEIRLSAGRIHDVSKRRVLAPLLAHLASKAPRACAIDELAHDVWQLRPSASLASAIKMTVARLRKLLGEHSDWVETDTRLRGELAYRIADHARLYVISEAEPGRSTPPKALV